MRLLPLLIFFLATGCMAQPEKLDDPEWGADYPIEGRAEWEAANGHIVLFFSWAASRGLVPESDPLGPEMAEEYESMMAAVSNRDADAFDRVLPFVASGLLTNQFTSRGAAFASECYERYKYEGYESYLGLSDWQMLEPTWDRFAKVERGLDGLFSEWQGAGCA